MSMYKFVKGSRLFMQGTRESSDYDNVADTFHPSVTEDNQHLPHHRLQVQEARSRSGSLGRSHSPSTFGNRFGLSEMGGQRDPGDIHAVHTLRSMTVDGSTEWERSAKTVRHGGIKTRSTRTVRKVTTITRGEQSVTSESIMRYGSDNSQAYPAVTHDKKNLKFRVVDKVQKYFTKKTSPLLRHLCTKIEPRVWAEKAARNGMGRH